MSGEKTLRDKLGARFLIARKNKKEGKIEYTGAKDLEDLFLYQNFPKSSNDKSRVGFYYVKLADLNNQADFEGLFTKKSKVRVVVGTCSYDDFKAFFKLGSLPRKTAQETGAGIDLAFIDVGQQYLNDLAAEFKNPIPKRSKLFAGLMNPSTWVTAAFGLIGIAAAMLATGAPAAVILSFMSMAFAALVAVPFAVGFSIWLIAKDFQKREIKALVKGSNRNVANWVKQENQPILEQLRAYNPPPYTFATYLADLPARLFKWAGKHKKQATVVGLGIVAAVAIVFLLVFGSGLGPVAATVGFLSQLFSSAFMGIGAGVGTLVPAVALPVVSTIAVAFSQAATVLASAVLVALPLVIADNVRRIASTIEELPKGWWRFRFNNSVGYQKMLNDDGEDVDPTASTNGSVNFDKAGKPGAHGGQGPTPLSAPPSTPAPPPFPPAPHDAPPSPVGVVTSSPGAPNSGASNPSPNPGGQ